MKRLLDWTSQTVPPIHIVLDEYEDGDGLVELTVPSSGFVLGRVKFDNKFWTDAVTKVAEAVYDYSLGEPKVSVNLIPTRIVSMGEVRESFAGGVFRVVVVGVFKPDAVSQVIALLGGGDDYVGVGKSGLSGVGEVRQEDDNRRIDYEIIEREADEPAAGEVRSATP